AGPRADTGQTVGRGRSSVAPTACSDRPARAGRAADEPDRRGPEVLGGDRPRAPAPRRELAAQAREAGLSVHPDTELTAFVAGALAPAERARVAAHLESCADCRQAVEESRAVLARRAARGAGPAPHGR